MRSNVGWLGALAALLAMAAAAAADESLRFEAEYDRLGRLAPQFTLGEDMAPVPARGEAALVEFWGLWCSDCLADGPYMDRVRTALAERTDVALVAVHAGGMGRFESLAEYEEETGYDIDTLMDPDRTIPGLFGVRWFPTYLVVDADGRITHMQTLLRREGGVARLLDAIDQARGHTPSAQ